jgi:VanZ family protein
MTSRWIPALAWGVLVVGISLMPGDAIPKTGVEWSDEAAHAAVYGMLAVFLHYAAHWPCLTCGVVVTAGCGLLGGAIELLQEVVPGRYGSPLDAVANTVGAAAASAVWIAWRRRRAKAA